MLLFICLLPFKYGQNILIFFVKSLMSWIRHEFKQVDIHA